MDGGLFLLFVIAACIGLGYFASDLSRLAREFLESRRSKHRFFYQGIKDLLENKSDEAVDTFIHSLKVNEATFDIHLALANFLRRRGEFDRAIRIHQNLLEQDGVSSEKRYQVESELGRDFLKAGLLDRAEDIFTSLATHSDTPLDVVDRVELSLIEIFEDTSDWERAKSVALQRYERSHYVNNIEMQSQASAAICQHECELYEDQRSASNEPGELKAILESALTHDQSNMRPKLLSYSHLIQAGQLERAIDEVEAGIQQGVQHSKEFSHVVINDLDRFSSEQLERLHAIQLANYRKEPSISGLTCLAKLLELRESGPAAVDFLLNELPVFPDLGAATELLVLVKERVPASDRSGHLAVRSILERLAKEQSCYECRQCGMLLKTMHWRCPTCKNWSTVAQNN